ncbi:HNH endonuclease signature motif containing protein, partial [Kineosporia sp. NBRC 101731]|uniref:HNH endonuclease signature motif containing protein n=1 Tax=Kineosporia sp. NBRC 101731 TaxID=3032199 RepID=UPI002555C308
PGDQARCTEPTTRYKPRQKVIDQVIGRFQHCVHPGCSRDARQCDIDHAIPFAQGGTSCPCNLVPLCRSHHRLKTHGGWKMRLTRPDEPYPTGSIEWKSRLGQHHVEEPPPMPGIPDRATRDRIREQEWQSELRRVDPTSHTAPAEPEAHFGEPPF